MSKDFIIEKGDLFRETVNSKIGYEDWEYTGSSLLLPNNEMHDEMCYCMHNDLGYFWFSEKEVREMERIGKNILACTQNK